MHIRILLFATVADQLGTSKLALDLAEDATVSDALDALQSSHPQIGPLRTVLAVAVNHVYSDPATKLVAGDEVALIPPVSGG